MHKNRFPALRYANNDRHKGALSSVSVHFCSFDLRGKFKEWSKEKVKMRANRSKSRTARSRTIEDKRNAEACFGKVNVFIMAFSAR
ncbi:hypothetical protein T01_7427 [Trichinella spiralis]|uniref:Uncharacterized protein n=1 Tax=Trichinella spiralis TaxID=6334 RepID=A0A0V1BQU2_TRISP|nr:hypothetical protein T01_7427 [Trichinella spiralis]